MATKSFVKALNLRGKKQCSGFVSALEDSSSRPSKKVVYSKTVQDMTTEQMKQIFGEEKNDRILAGQPS